MSNNEVIQGLRQAIACEGISISPERLLRDLQDHADLAAMAASLTESGTCSEYAFEIFNASWGSVNAAGELDKGGALLIFPSNAPTFVARIVHRASGPSLQRIHDGQSLELDISSLQADTPLLLVRSLPRERWQDEAGYRSERRYQWFLGHLYAQWPAYTHVLLASAILSLLAILGTFYTMNVYDRVVPNSAFNTLWVLSIGVVVAYFFEFLLKEVRGVLADSAARKIDVAISGVLFSKVLNMQLLARPASSGVMAGHLREFESVRDFFTSLSILVVLDMPFFWVFLAIMYYIGGAIVLVPVVAIPIVIAFLAVIQAPMAKAVERASATSSQKQGLLIEAINGQLDIKVLGAGPILRRLWDSCSVQSAAESNKARYWSSLGVNFATLVQQIVQVGLIIVGVYKITAGELTMGGLIACSILNGRLMAPLGQAVSLGVRAQQTLQAIQTLSRIMAKPEDRLPGRRYIAPARLSGSIELQQVEFRYRPDDATPAVGPISLKIREGERVAIVGRSGCGKTTLLKLMAGLLEPQAGALYLGGRDTRQIDPPRLRQHIAYVPQAPVLISGTIRENLCMGKALADDEELLTASRVAVLDDHIAQHPQGYDRQVGESGMLLSGGQRQCLAIARGLLGQPHVILLDEPTSAMDMRTEQEFRSRFSEHARNNTVVLVTHKTSMLDMVDRVIVMENGKIVSDTAKEKLQAAMKRAVPTVKVSAEGGEHVHTGA